MIGQLIDEQCSEVRLCHALVGCELAYVDVKCHGQSGSSWELGPWISWEVPSSERVRDSSPGYRIFDPPHVLLRLTLPKTTIGFTDEKERVCVCTFMLAHVYM